MTNPLCVPSLPHLVAQASLRQHSVRQATEAWEWMRANQLKKLAKNLSDTTIMGKVVARKTNTLLTAVKKTPASFQRKLQKHEHTIKEVNAVYAYILDNRRWDLLPIVQSPIVNDQIQHVDCVRALYTFVRWDQLDMFNDQLEYLKTQKKQVVPREVVTRLTAIALEHSPQIFSILWPTFNPKYDPKHLIARTVAGLGRLNLLQEIHDRLGKDQGDEVIGPQLQQAASNGHVEIVEYLLAKTQWNDTKHLLKSLEWAALNGHSAVANILLQQPQMEGSLVHATLWAIKGQDPDSIVTLWKHVSDEEQFEVRKYFKMNKPQELPRFESVLCKHALLKDIPPVTSVPSKRRM